MKKVISLAVMLAMAFSCAAYAQMGMGRGMGRGPAATANSVANVDEAKALVLKQATNLKGAKVVSATEDRREKTVLDLIQSKKRKDLFPVGRLDKDTEGLLLITNDGMLAHRLLSPGKHVDKTYFVRVQGRVTEKEVELFGKRVNIGTSEKPEWTMPAELTVLESGEISEVRLTIQEGKYHQIKRMFQAVDMKVLYLKRERMGLLKLDLSLEPGQYRALTQEEIQRVADKDVTEY